MLREYLGFVRFRSNLLPTSFQEYYLIFLCVVLEAGSGAVNFIIDHAEIDFIFVQDKKVKEVRIERTWNFL